MMEVQELRKKFRVYIDKAYDYEESLKRHKFIDQNDVTRLRQKVVNYPHVPRLIHDKLVSLN